jgi:hypothetical protein
MSSEYKSRFQKEQERIEKGHKRFIRWETVGYYVVIFGTLAALLGVGYNVYVVQGYLSHKVLLNGNFNYNTKNGIMTIKNENFFDWKWPMFSLDTDDDPATYEYLYYTAAPEIIKEGEVFKLDLASFTANGTTDFIDMTTIKPRHLSLWAGTPWGSGHVIYNWR